RPRRVERRAPAALVVLSQLQILALAVHPHRDPADPGPGVESTSPFPSSIIPDEALPHNAIRCGDDVMGYRMRVVTSVAVIGLLVLASEAASQPPTVPEAPLVIEGRVLWVDFGRHDM